MKRFLLWFLPGLIVGALIILGGGKALHMTSTNEYCISCHIHPLADAAWKNPYIMIQNQVTGSAVSIAIFLQQGEGIL